MKRKQSGIAAVTAVLIVAVAASAASLMLAQQAAMLDQTMLVASRAQADQFARAGLDWARGVLLQDSNAVDSPGDNWAQPLAALPVERALVAGAIDDEQAKFNLNNLVNAAQKSPDDIEAFRRILAALALAPELADAVVDWIDRDSDLASTAGAEDAYYLSLRRPYRTANANMVQVEELYRIRGFNAAAVAKLKPYVTALPVRTSINVNTAPEGLLRALLPEVPQAKVAKFIAERAKNPIADKTKIKDWAAEAPAARLADFDVKSAFFSVRIQVAQDDVELATDALVRREGGPPAIVWRRPRY